ncbi:hypothetical protein BBO99_00005297 [Phytophthora kernoviae]|uniref:HSF-type DNA-binding domain-containing protein n=2 Tax=Phytophthora kernoviae TaxID=325452 RepID=A0A421GP32_9STRA|nr:hypothetical protein G195_010631 [Phytophthora kernoviae 00238/432]KAG2525441.1 hypothetical protein JM16_004398 [Phytophthora kernoviae]KAG2526818.1 hypothetical protein JM18_004140 [Phytophthora kernoviae]RLN13793.1 hypothetical protein BBI17_005147 [Phytophthora kernoviae]RLN79398.1 hypothetical protein BBO99_00005297 [Phytophthora kernoviae]
MLEEEDKEILRWTPNGCAFEILDMERMMATVLPKYFKHRKYTSFQRQLNYFNFKKWTKSKAVVCTFSNESFMRDRPDLAWRITRKKSVHVASKSGGLMPHKAKILTLPASAAKTDMKLELPNVKLEPLSMKLEHPQLHQAPPPPTKPTGFPGKNLWKRDMAIRVPRVPSMFNEVGSGPYGSGRQIPSPTDMDLMLLENDMEPQRYYHYESIAPLPLSEQDVDSLEWVDNFLPSLETAPRQDELVFAGNTVNKLKLA